jgi:hypothetical protein
LDGKLFQVGSIVGGGATETALRTGTSFVPIGCSVDEGLEILSSRTNDMDIVYADGDQKCQMIQLPSGLKESYRISEEDGQICVEYGVETSDGTVLSDEQYDHISELLSNVTLKIGDRVFLEY